VCTHAPLGSLSLHLGVVGDILLRSWAQLKDLYLQHPYTLGCFSAFFCICVCLAAVHARVAACTYHFTPRHRKMESLFYAARRSVRCERHKAALGSLESSPRPPRKNTSCRRRRQRRARDFLSGDRKSFLVSERKFYILRRRGLSKRNGSCNSSRSPRATAGKWVKNKTKGSSKERIVI
jgi:hypothetical protein